MIQIPDEILPGDVLLYRTPSLIGWLIRTKTWSPVNHVEIAVSPTVSVGSREGVGVSSWTPLRSSGLYAVLRAQQPLDIATGLVWHRTVTGQGYDYLGLFTSFFSERGRGSMTRMFCSEHSTRFLRHAGLEPFTALTDADKVSPGMFMTSPAFSLVWHAEPGP